MNLRLTRLERICEEFGIRILYVFGSQAEGVRDWVAGLKGKIRFDQSDVDVGVKGQPGEKRAIKDKVRLSGSLEDYFGCSRVDLVFLEEADPFLAAEIIRGERLMAQDENEADEYELYVLRRAGDLAFLERERIALLLEGGS